MVKVCNRWNVNGVNQPFFDKNETTLEWSKCKLVTASLLCVFVSICIKGWLCGLVGMHTSMTETKWENKRHAFTNGVKERETERGDKNNLKHKDRETERQRDRETERQRDRKTNTK